MRTTRKTEEKNTPRKSTQQITKVRPAQAELKKEETILETINGLTLDLTADKSQYVVVNPFNEPFLKKVKSYLKQEFNIENFNFLTELREICLEYEKDESTLSLEKKENLNEKLNYLIEEYVLEQSPQQVNLDYDTLNQLKALYDSKKLTIQSFENAAKEIKKLLCTDPFTRLTNKFLSENKPVAELQMKIIDIIKKLDVDLEKYIPKKSKVSSDATRKLTTEGLSKITYAEQLKEALNGQLIALAIAITGKDIQKQQEALKTLLEYIHAQGEQIEKLESSRSAITKLKHVAQQKWRTITAKPDAPVKKAGSKLYNVLYDIEVGLKRALPKAYAQAINEANLAPVSEEKSEERRSSFSTASTSSESSTASKTPTPPASPSMSMRKR